MSPFCTGWCVLLPFGQDRRLKQRPELRNDATLMRLSLTDISFGLAFLPAALWASPYDGVYKQTANAECALVGVDGGSLKIEENIFYGVEVECHMINPVEVEDMNATIYEMQCSGEGEAWTERAMLMPDAQGTGLYMIWSGYAFRYDRCEAPVR
ncbi:hypothetical protein C7964_10386 [Loktanella sp. PT4BL]|nr:hypothetical protein C7964_10386 [Loktanella sp. PT4BL]